MCWRGKERGLHQEDRRTRCRDRYLGRRLKEEVEGEHRLDHVFEFGAGEAQNFLFVLSKRLNCYRNGSLQMYQLIVHQSLEERSSGRPHESQYVEKSPLDLYVLTGILSCVQVLLHSGSTDNKTAASQKIKGSNAACSRSAFRASRQSPNLLRMRESFSIVSL